MKFNSDGLLTAIFLLIAGALIGFVIGYDVAHRVGYRQAFEHASYYFQATGEWPSEEWIDYHRGDHFQTPGDILETIKPFTEK